MISNNSWYCHWPFLLVLMLALAAYWIGLDSRFLLDDFSNLPSLDDVERNGYLYYIFTNNSGPSGRPLSLLSFALQYSDWPANPQAFKAVNLAIHLFNGILIYLLTLSLSRFIRPLGVGGRWFSLLVAALWLIHPIHVNTVLYVVQRMALLSTFFTLAGLYTYLRLWDPRYPGGNRKKLFAGSVLYTSCLLLAVFSKENGILLPLFILCVEFTLLKDVKRSATWKLWIGIFILTPLILCLIYLVLGFSDNMENYAMRSYTMTDRLLTEARVIIIYLKHLLIPNPSSFSLFHDDFTASKGLFNPLTTLFAIVAIVLILISAFIFRKRNPAYTFGICWFFTAHLLESTYLNLELYFEHRNYLASFGILFIVVIAMLGIRRILSSARVANTLIGAMYLLIVMVTLSEITLWSRPVEQTLEWKRRSPQSTRAILEVGDLYLRMGLYNKAIMTYNQITNIHPDDIYPRIQSMTIKSCFKGETVDRDEWNLLHRKAAKAKWNGVAPVVTLDRLTVQLLDGDCDTINIYALVQLIVIIATNPYFSHHSAQLHELAALLNGAIGEADAAIENASKAIEVRPSPQRYLLKLRILLDVKKYDEARDTLDTIKKRYKNNVRFHLAYDDMIGYFEDRLVKVQASENNN